ncbi:MAG: PEPxxWA-CTERM sorting domain-containing protein [Sphingomonas sp.]
MPEPSTWAFMIAGFFALGGALRRRGAAPRSGIASFRNVRRGRAAGGSAEDRPLGGAPADVPR